jgi:hypothetical protein
MINSIEGAESLTLVTPLGLRFWDDASSSSIGDGLTVVAYPKANPALRVQAFTNRIGTYVFQNLPLLRAIEKGTGDDNFWSNLPPKLPFIVEVTDRQQRFQPFLVPVDLPVRGLFTWSCPSARPPQAQSSAMIPLYSAPARIASGGQAVLRAALWDPQQGVPAAWTLLEASIGGKPLARGFADRNGYIALIFSYPEPTDFAPIDNTNAPVGKSVPLTQHTWTIQLKAAYAPLNPVSPMMDLCTILSQASATLWADLDRTQPLTEVTLNYGQELIVRSTNTQTHTPLSLLFITPRK